MVQEQSDAVGVMAGKVATYGGGSAALIFGMSAAEIAAIVGAIVAVAGYLTQLYFSRKRERREMAEHQARMAEFKAGYREACDVEGQ